MIPAISAIVIALIWMLLETEMLAVRLASGTYREYSIGIETLEDDYPEIEDCYDDWDGYFEVCRDIIEPEYVEVLDYSDTGEDDNRKELQKINRAIVAEDKLYRLLPIYRRIQRRKDQVADITLREYRELTGKEFASHVVTGVNGRKYVSFQSALDYVCDEYGYEDSESLYEALENLARIA